MNLVQGGEHFFCAYCRTYFFPTESDDGVKVLGEVSDVPCPVCKIPLVSASISKISVLHCTTCRGILAKQPLFRAIVDYRRAISPELSLPPRPWKPKDDKRRLQCPICDRSMDNHVYYGPGHVVIDTCAHCAIVWLDHGELSNIVNAPGRDRGRLLGDAEDILWEERDELPPSKLFMNH